MQKGKGMVLLKLNIRYIVKFQPNFKDLHLKLFHNISES